MIEFLSQGKVCEGFLHYVCYYCVKLGFEGLFLCLIMLICLM